MYGNDAAAAKVLNWHAWHQWKASSMNPICMVCNQPIMGEVYEPGPFHAEEQECIDALLGRVVTLSNVVEQYANDNNWDMYLTDRGDMFHPPEWIGPGNGPELACRELEKHEQ